MDAYKDFAYVYDELMDETPYQSWCERIVGLIERYGVSKPVRQARGSLGQEDGASDRKEVLGEKELLLRSERDLVVDLGCGTGTLTQLFYEKGYDMIGVDSSEEMLDVAMQKRDRSGAEILYLLQDMRELELYSTVGAVISVCDSLNYILEEEELLQVFRLVENYLYPGGIFVFDFNTVYKYEEVIGNATIAENREDCSFIWENYYYPEETLNEYDLTVFVHEDGALFRRFTETHLQRGYLVDQVLTLIEKAGLEVVLVRDSDTDKEVSETTERAYVVAKEHRKKENV